MFAIMTFYHVLVLISGLFLGSLVSILVYRVPEKRKLSAPPVCHNCGKKLGPMELIPIAGWLIQGGRCRYCKAPISLRYILIELMTAFAILGLYMEFGFSLAFFAFTYFIPILTAVFFIDIERKEIPDELVLAGLAGGAAVMVINIFRPGLMIYGGNAWWYPLAGMFSGSGILLLVAIIGMLVYKNEDALGMGDVKLFAPIGLFLGWKLCLAALFFSIMIAGFSSLFLIITKIKGRKDAIPFGPFIVAGTYLCIVYGWDIINWYTGMQQG